MSNIDLFVLAVLSNKNKLSLREVVSRICEIGLDKPPSRSGLYKRLEILKLQDMIQIEWKFGKKQYLISSKGLKRIKKLTNQLIRTQV